MGKITIVWGGSRILWRGVRIEGTEGTTSYREVWGHVPPESFKSGTSETPFPGLSGWIWGKRSIPTNNHPPPPPPPPTPLRSATAYVHFLFWYQGQTIISCPVSKNFHLPFLKPALLCILNTPADRTQISLQLHNIIHCPRQGLVCPELNRKMRDPESRACLLKGLDKTAVDPYVLVIPILQRTSLLLQFHGWWNSLCLR